MTNGETLKPRLTGEMERTLSVQEAAAFLQMSPLTLRKRAAAGRVPAYKPGKAWAFLLDELHEYLKAHKQCPSIAAPTLRTFGAVSGLRAVKSGSQLAQQIANKRRNLRLLREAQLGGRPS
jgi:excisionase family DNA binding protein